MGHLGYVLAAVFKAAAVRAGWGSPQAKPVKRRDVSVQGFPTSVLLFPHALGEIGVWGICRLLAGWERRGVL